MPPSRCSTAASRTPRTPGSMCSCATRYGCSRPSSSSERARSSARWSTSARAEDDLGDNRFTIGIWVGGAVTPNDRAEARCGAAEAEPRRQLRREQVRRSALPVVRRSDGRDQEHRPEADATRRESPATSSATEPSSCAALTRRASSPTACRSTSSTRTSTSDPPTLVIGTVDKFAMLAWRPEARALFGIGAGRRRAARRRRTSSSRTSCT